MKNNPVIFNSLSQLHKAMGQNAPNHPLISILNYGEAAFDPKDFEQGIILNFYKISFKTNFTGQLKYGQGFYDFEEGGMSFIAPGQLLRMQTEEADYSGMSLHIHPDFLRSYSLNANIKQYGFFNYSAAEALYLSGKEKATILSIYKFIEEELSERIDKFSQDVIISQIELLLNYANRFYDRQFITRKLLNNEILSQLETYLDNYFNNEESLTNGLPSVSAAAEELKLTPRYLSDLLRHLIGQNTQQYIHEKVIEKAKELLAKDELNIAEIAYHLGFEHPQSLTKLFKNKTNLTPLKFKELIFKN
ncbi:DNA-binding transcriptional regulator AraC [Mariniflexile rhizosphaerae]|uniref:helix-turn-helix domain-containing protein n=1 Tax=unclassified Mariniflexile TaxID=2643887 RepID=UPI000CA7E3BA|nr:helix-turn-helix domain-containing protein [Mariniflexile sp. TRM1-10]AXP82154.1 DNA-binding transcriptional regulator AraC [Mariniflexile sp. TRM1-10]PLB20199.1 MAG: Transcriptional regulator, AraC family [Flavobacteriaceae bacterium FS1-H7996/R]